MYSSTSRGASTGLATFLALYLLFAPVMADWTYSYCSSQNTAAGTQSFEWDWQSNGKCHDHCQSQGTYAFAVIQYKDCWCSNYIPQDQADISDCSDTCPGYATENCGKANQYYVYVKLDGSPSGTAGGSSPSSTQPSPAPPSTTVIVITPDPSTVVSTVTSEEVVTVPLSTDPSSTVQTSATTQSAPAPPRTSILVVTDSTGGGVRTQTVIVTPTVTPEAEVAGKSSSNTGAIVGGVVGGIAVLAAIVAGVLFLLWRRKKQHSEESGEAGEPGVHRYASTMSKSGLLRGEKEPQHPAPLATTWNRRQSRPLDQDSISPISASNRRNSSYQVDQRLNPSTIFVFDNSSRGSVGSLDDSRDYHRTLNVRNPDAE